MIEIHWHPTDKELRIFAGSQLLLFGILSAVLWSYDRTGLATALLSISSIAAIIGFIKPQVIRHYYLAWMVAAFPIGWVFLHLVLGTVYYGVIWPIGGVLRLCGWDPMHRRWDASATTYWQQRPPTPQPERYYRQF